MNFTLICLYNKMIFGFNDRNKSGVKMNINVRIFFFGVFYKRMAKLFKIDRITISCNQCKNLLIRVPAFHDSWFNFTYFISFDHSQVWKKLAEWCKSFAKIF